MRQAASLLVSALVLLASFIVKGTDHDEENCPIRSSVTVDAENTYGKVAERAECASKCEIGEKCSVPWWNSSALDKDRDSIADALESKLDSGMANVIVSFSRTINLDDKAALNARFPGAQIYENINMASIPSLNRAQVESLLGLDGVVFVEASYAPVFYSDVATPAALARGSAMYSPHTAWELGYTGKGVNIAITDTGIDNAHPSLEGKLEAGADFSKPETPFTPRDGSFDPDDTQGHGTTCAGIATGTGAPDGKYMGAAPDADLVDARIGTIIGYAPGEGPGSWYDASLLAIDWEIEHIDDNWGGVRNSGIDVLSLSWGVDVGGSSDGSDAYSRALDDAVDAGIICVVAAGNSGPDNDGFDGMGASSNVITIGATDDKNTISRADDIIASYSSRGPRKDNGNGYPYDELKPDISAPGTGIIQAEFDRVGDGAGNGYGDRGSGTSYATPLVAGVVALMIEANANLTPAIYKEILRATSERRGSPSIPELDPFWNKDFGWGIVDAYNATKLAHSISDPDAVDVELQCFFTGVRMALGGVEAIPEGLAFSRVGNVSYVEVSIDGKAWTKVDFYNQSGIYSQFNVKLKGLSKGNHTIAARAVSGSKHSLPHEISFEVNQSIPDKGTMGEMPATPMLALLLIVASVAAIVYFRKEFAKIIPKRK